MVALPTPVIVPPTPAAPNSRPPTVVVTPITLSWVALIKSVAPVPVNPEPSPENKVAVTVPSTSNFVSGIVLPIPTLPLVLIPVRVFLFPNYHVNPKHNPYYPLTFICWSHNKTIRYLTTT